MSVRVCTHVCAVQLAPMSMLPGVYGPGKGFLLFSHTTVPFGLEKPSLHVLPDVAFL